MKIAINGFGRIGRTFLRACYEKGIEIVAVNDLTDVSTLAHLLKYDSTYGIFDGDVKVKDNSILIDNKQILVLAEEDPLKLPWQKLEVDLVIESTGVFRDYDSAFKHITAGAKKVIITAPFKGKKEIKTVVPSVNEDTLLTDDKIISMASCTTNCLAPILKILNESLTVENAVMSTIHSFTMDQVLQDAPHKDLRRARAATESIIPTTTGATDAVELTLPELKGKLIGISYRVPTQTVSVVDLVAKVSKNSNIDEVNSIFKEASKEQRYNKAISVTDLPLVSKDFLGMPYGVIVDLSLTQVVLDNTIKVVAWYDNEMGYSYRLLDLVDYLSKRSFE